MDDRWTTKLTIRDDATGPPIPLMTTPTGIAMATPTPNKLTEQANSLYECSNTHQLMHYYYACLNYPVPSSLIQAIDRMAWPHFPMCVTPHHRIPRVVIGPHGPSLERHSLRATTNSNQRHHSHAGITSHAQPTHQRLHGRRPQEPHNARIHIIFMHSHAINGATSSNQTGRFPITSNRGNAYVVVFYVFDANYTCSVPIKNRSKEELLSAYRKTYEWMTLRGFKPPSFTQWTTRHRTR